MSNTFSNENIIEPQNAFESFRQESIKTRSPSSQNITEQDQIVVNNIQYKKHEFPKFIIEEDSQVNSQGLDDSTQLNKPTFIDKISKDASISLKNFNNSFDYPTYNRPFISEKKETVDNLFANLPFNDYQTNKPPLNYDDKKNLTFEFNKKTAKLKSELENSSQFTLSKQVAELIALIPEMIPYENKDDFNQYMIFINFANFLCIKATNYFFPDFKDQYTLLSEFLFKTLIFPYLFTFLPMNVKKLFVAGSWIHIGLIVSAVFLPDSKKNTEKSGEECCETEFVITTKQQEINLDEEPENFETPINNFVNNDEEILKYKKVNKRALFEFDQDETSFNFKKKKNETSILI